MPVKLRKGFRESEQGKDIHHILHSMTLDDKYNTTSSYSADTTQYPDNLIPFVDKHMNYLSTHPQVEANQYIANIKLKARLR